MSIAEQSNAEINQLRRNSCNGKPKEMAADTCRVCGDGNAKMHYGVVTCFGCKGFFRRTLKRPTEYQCRHNGLCVVDRHERNSCRYCRFKKCIEVGMDPKAVRPDRDATGRHYQSRQRRSKLSTDDDGEVDSEWLRKLPVDMRTTLMQLMNIDLMVGSGDGTIDGKSIYPLALDSIRRALEDPSILDGKRTEMRYEGLREVEPSELPAEVHRRVLAVIDWVDHLCDLMDLQNLEDKVALVKHGFAPLMVFAYSAITARNSKKDDIICLCNFGFVRRTCCEDWAEPYHFANHLAERSIDELIRPFRKMNLKEEEISLLNAIIILNPHIKSLSTEAAEAIADLRDRIHETLYHVVRETHPKEVASSRFGNLLLFIPSVMMLGTIVMENLQFVDSFGHMTDLLIHDLLRDDLPQPNAVATPSNGLSSEMNVERRMSEPQIPHSSSSSSLASLNSIPSSSSSYQQGLTYNFSSNSLPATVSQFDVSLNQTSSMPNLEQIADCDPDYNLTLTPDMYTDMRQAMSAAHNMDTSLSLPEPHQSPTSPQTDRPTFYIESTKHKFAVTPFDAPYGYPPPQPPPQNYPQPGEFQAVATAPQIPQSTQQATLTKSNSLPLQYYQFEPPTGAFGQPMDFDDSFY